jgi:probable addiction module antidote protein
MTRTKTKTARYDSAEYLETEGDVASYLDEALATGDVAFIVEALGTVARARGMTQIAKDAQLSRESLYKALRADGNPEFSTVLRVLQALKMKLTVEPSNV